jgi:arsenical pump membrane protein
MPALGTWLALFTVPSIAAITLTYLTLGFISRRDLREPIEPDVRVVALERSGRIVLGGIATTAIALTIASSHAFHLGLVTAISAAVVYTVSVAIDRSLARVVTEIAWGVLPFVAGLFIVVAGIDATAVLASVRAGVVALGRAPELSAIYGAGFATALVSNVTNNLPMGLFAGLALGGVPHHLSIAAATTIGVDLGPNLSVTGSLATILWLMALRREEIVVGPIAFVRVGALVMFPALIAALGALVVVAPR